MIMPNALPRRARRASRWIAAAVLSPALLLSGTVAHAQSGAPARRAAPTAFIVSVGDSYISGEAGRWAGNTATLGSAAIDALGPKAYFDNPTHTAELIPLCHRSLSAEIHIGGTVEGKNLACSGARTYTFFDGDHFKPGLDFYNVGGHQGQALMLQEYAKTHHVTMVAVSIGGNDFGFGDIVKTCVEDFLNPLGTYYCKDDPAVLAHFSSANVAFVTARIAAALRNVNQAMARAGYSESSYKILLQNYPAPLPYGSAIRYPETYERFSKGGCALYNTDIDWALDYALPKISAAVFTAAAHSGLRNIVKMDISSAFHPRRLCQNTVGLLEEKGLSSWKDPGAVDLTEWIDAIHSAPLPWEPFFQQESLHPNYWAQMALRSCVRQAYNNGAVRGGACTISGDGLTVRREPRMHLADTSVRAGVGTAGGLVVSADGQHLTVEKVRQVAVASDPVHGLVAAWIGDDGSVWAKQGGPNAPWLRQHIEGLTARQVEVATDPVHGPLIAVLATNGRALAKQGLFEQNWTNLYANAPVAQVSIGSDAVRGPLIAVLTTAGAVYAKEGGVQAPWVWQGDDLRQVAVAADPVRGPLIAVVDRQGAARAKEGALNASWTPQPLPQRDAVAQLAVASDPVNGPLIAALAANKVLWAKQGLATGDWVSEYPGVLQAAIATDPVHGPLIATVDEAREWRSKQGGLRAAWTLLGRGISQTSVASS